MNWQLSTAAANRITKRITLDRLKDEKPFWNLVLDSIREEDPGSLFGALSQYLAKIGPGCEAEALSIHHQIALALCSRYKSIREQQVEMGRAVRVLLHETQDDRFDTEPLR